jgi:hypothetical protein
LFIKNQYEGKTDADVEGKSARSKRKMTAQNSSELKISPDSFIQN